MSRWVYLQIGVLKQTLPIMTKKCVIISGSFTEPCRRPGRHPEVRGRFVARPDGPALGQGELSCEAAGRQGEGHTVYTDRRHRI